MKNKKTILILLIITAFGAWLRIKNIGAGSLLFDEASSFTRCTENNIRNIVTPIGYPLYYIILHFFLKFGHSEFLIRLPSALFGIFSIPVLYLLSKSMFNDKTALLITLLFSISFFHIDYSQYAKMYTLYTFLGLLSIYFFYSAIKDGSKGKWIAYSVTTILCYYTVYLIAFFVIAEVLIYLLFLFSKSDRKEKINISKCFLISLLIIVLCCIPTLHSLFGTGKNLASIQSSISIPRGYKISNPLTFFKIMFGCFLSPRQLPLSINLLKYGIILLSFIGIIFPLKQLKRERLLLTFLIFIPTLILWGLHFKMFISIPRYLILQFPLFLIGLSNGIFEFSKGISQKIGFNKKNIQILVSLFLSTIVVIFSLYFTFCYYSEPRNADWRSVGKYLKLHAQPRDAVVMIPVSPIKRLKYYYDLEDKNIELLPVGVYTDSALASVAEERKRIWLIYSICHMQLRDPNNQIKNWLEQNANLKLSPIKGPLVFLIDRTE